MKRATGRNRRKMPKAYSYIRFSTGEQAKGDSFRRQVELSNAYASAHGLEIDDSLRMTDLGKSAYKGKHITTGALGIFLRAVEEGKVERGSYLLVESFDRLSRAAVTDALRMFLNLLSAGIIIVTLADQRVYSEKSVSGDPLELIISIVIMSRAHEESAMKGRRVANAWARKRDGISERALTATCPGWLRKRKDWSGFDLIEDRAKVVREIFELARQGVGQSEIARRLTLRKEPTWTRGNRKALGWHPSYIAKILANRAAIGHFQPHRIQDGKRVPDGEEIKNYFPAVVPEEDFYAVQNRRPRPAGKFANTVTNLFTRLAWDGYHPDCKMRYEEKGSTSRGLGKWCYLVSDSRRIHPGSRKIFWRYPHFEKCFLAFVDGFDWSTVAGKRQSAELAELEDRLQVAEADRKELADKIEKLIDAVASTTDRPATLVARIKSGEIELNERDDAIKALRRQVLRIQSDEKALHENIGELRRLVADSADPAAFEGRTRLREELRRKIRKIQVFPFGWPVQEIVGTDRKTGEPLIRSKIPEPATNPGILVEFSNGATSLITCSSMKEQPKITFDSPIEKVSALHFWPADDSLQNPTDDGSGDEVERVG